MIPIHLSIAGFLSYRDRVELDFTTFDLACISGQNGAGKSSLLDAMTWALFGEARGRSSDVINLHPDVKAAEVQLVFSHEDNTYRVQRSLPRNKNTVLEFQVQTSSGWKPLTEKTTRDTQARIEQTLRLDFDTFVNASFFLQGKADQFTQQNASKRKEVLSNILGLEVWEEYKIVTAERRKAIEREVAEIEWRLAEINAELGEEEMRRKRLAELEALLSQLSTARAAQDAILENIRTNAVLLDKQREAIERLEASLERSRLARAALQDRLAAREADRASYADLIDRAREIEAAYKAWQRSRKELEEWDQIASRFHEQEKDRMPLLESIAAEKAKLEQEKRSLLSEEQAVTDHKSSMEALKVDIENTQSLLGAAEADVTARLDLENRRNAARERQAELKAENEALRADMNQLKERIDSLAAAEGATCPLCGQALSEQHRTATLEQLEAEGREKGDRYRANQDESKELATQMTETELQIAKLGEAENERVRYASEVSQLNERLTSLHSLTKDWTSVGRKRLKEVEKVLEGGKYALEEQKQLAKLDRQLTKLGYDAAAHDAARQAEMESRHIEQEYTRFQSAREVSKQIESEIANLRSELETRQAEIEALEKDYSQAKANLEAAEAQAPSLEDAERELFRLREEENKVRLELGGAQQKVDVLAMQRTRKATLEKECEELQRQITRHKTLERAFGKDGVPALLIEQSLPQIEIKANELLDRLSDGQMGIRFITQKEYKDKKRDDLKETLEIQINDSAGIRNYEMYSGGEAFRVNFAIRLALSEVLAQRKGARLQTLVIDEGFGSQDARGRQRLIEAINLVKDDFAKILVITHLDELKDAFPTRIEVEKTERGSVIRVV
jgi:exonuclease SbcC